MAFYNYKRVCHRPDFAVASKEWEVAENEVYEGDNGYDGDAWLVVEFLLDKKDEEIKRLQAIIEDFHAQKKQCA